MSNKEDKYSPTELEKQYNKKWLNASLYNPNKEGKPFAIVFPPPNVTGILHIGHALNFTLQDIYSRYKTIQGYKVLWIPGVDHAGIATQMMVEKSLIKEGKTRRGLGRKEFLKRIWKWKDSYADRIISQLHNLNISCTWDRLRFTLDEGLSKAVNKTFVMLYESKLIYRDKRLVNWDTSLKTAVSDLEVIHEEKEEVLYDINYHIVDKSNKVTNKYITVSTVRPETIFGDEAIAINPKDNKNKHLIGKKCKIPLINKIIPIIADTMVKQDFGTGLVKITPAHDFNDFKVGKRHKLAITQIIDLDGKLNNLVPVKWQGIDRLEARSSIIEDLRNLNSIKKERKYLHSIPIGDRSRTQIEPTITWQWFVDAKKLADPVLEKLEQNCTEFHPHKWKKEFSNWLKKIEPWCISRQLWWGHRIPAWFSEKGIIVAETEEEAKQKAKDKFGEEVSLEQDNDVLDTWFSSALWPYSVLGWPDEINKKDIETFYPAALLITANDILFFWVARMMMLGIYTHGKESFKNIYINTIVKDSKGRKMSKTKDNAIDPMISIKKYGADSLRLALAIQAGPNKDIRMDEAKIEGMRFFSTKIWNAIRFLLINLQKHKDVFTFSEDKTDWKAPESNWILSEWSTALKEITQNLDNYRPEISTQKIYKFIWSVFCDWYIEIIKIDFSGTDKEKIAEHLQCSYKIITEYLIVLHPFAPVISEELWNKVEKAFMEAAGKQYNDKFLLKCNWPVNNPLLKINTSDVKELKLFQDVVSEIRALKSMFDNTTSSIKFCITSSENQKWQNYYSARISSITNINIYKENNENEVKIELKIKSLVCNIFIDKKDSVENVLKKLNLNEEKTNNIYQKRLVELSNKKFIDNAPKEIFEEKKASAIELKQELDNINQQKDMLLKSLS